MDFISYVKNFDILLFGETWQNKNDPYDFGISDYECAHVYAKKSHGVTTGRFSGGVTVYYRSSLKQFISVIHKSDDGLIWIKLDKHFLSSDKDAYLCYVYVRDKNSKVLQQDEIDYFEILQSDISKYSTFGDVYVAGDVNGRTSEEPDFLLQDYYLNVGMNENLRDNEIPLRKSRDLVLDNYGRRLLDLCKATDLLIANGRLGDDKDIGEFTCVTSRGRSVVDYLLLSLQNFDCVSHFKICDIDEHSDHSALYFCLKLSENDIDQNHTHNASTSEKKLIWTCKNQEKFKMTILNQYTKYDDIITNIENDISYINAGVHSFSKLLFDDSFQYFGKSVVFEPGHQSKPSNISNPWFDNTCKTAK